MLPVGVLGEADPTDSSAEAKTMEFKWGLSPSFEAHKHCRGQMRTLMDKLSNQRQGLESMHVAGIALTYVISPGKDSAC